MQHAQVLKTWNTNRLCLICSQTFLMTWKGGGTDKAREDFQDELQLSHGLRANNFNLDRMLVSLKRRNPLSKQIH